MNFIDIRSVKFNSFNDAAAALIWLSDGPQGTAAHSPRPLPAAGSGGCRWSHPCLAGVTAEMTAGIPSTVLL